VIPGILGSRLEDEETGRVVWGAFGGDFADPGQPAGARLLALPMAPGAPLAELRDRVRPAGALDRVRVRLLGLSIEQQAYLYVLRTLGVGGYRDQDLGRMGQVDYGAGHFTCFQFGYDWRRDNAENARRLHAFILDRRAYVLAELARRGQPAADVKFDLVAHSMGGLLARYYLLHGPAPLPEDGSLPPITWDGTRHVERAVFIGTPNAGSVEALRQLVEGTRFPFPLPRYEPAVLGTMPSIYQLLTRSRHARVVDAGGQAVDVLDPGVWERHGWGLAASSESERLAWLLPAVSDPADRRRVALEHQRKALRRAAQFQAAMDRPATPPEGVTLHLFAGDATPTPAVVQVDAAGRLTVREEAPGDGTVTRASAVLDERVGGAWSARLRSPIAWTDVTFLFSDHLGMTRDPAFTDNVLFRLLEFSRARARGAGPRVSPPGERSSPMEERKSLTPS
jgi:pimeloyl-ACP methyl ester carboxylesterase